MNWEIDLILTVFLKRLIAAIQLTCVVFTNREFQQKLRQRYCVMAELVIQCMSQY